MLTPNGRNIHPANLIRLAYSRYKHVCANTIGVVNVNVLNTQWETGLVLLAKIRSASLIRRDNAIYKAVACGNGKRLLTQKLHIQISYKLRSPQYRTKVQLLSPFRPT
jgi:hypothetical protein